MPLPPVALARLAPPCSRRGGAPFLRAAIAREAVLVLRDLEQPLIVPCPRCGGFLRRYGDGLWCDSCKQAVEGPKRPPVRPPPPPLRPPEVRGPAAPTPAKIRAALPPAPPDLEEAWLAGAWRGLGVAALAGVAFFCLASWLALRWEADAWLAYPALFFGLLALAGLAASRWPAPPRFRSLLAVAELAFALGVSCFFGASETFTEWSQQPEFSLEDGTVRKMTFVDVVDRASRRTVHRMASWHEYRDGQLINWGEDEFSFSDSGKVHGEWKHSEKFDRSSLWYWYGDEVSEGEFHRFEGGER